MLDVPQLGRTLQRRLRSRRGNGVVVMGIPVWLRRRGSQTNVRGLLGDRIQLLFMAGIIVPPRVRRMMAMLRLMSIHGGKFRFAAAALIGREKLSFYP
jgi:hypothetical protein